MASTKVKFRPSVVEGKEGIIYYQVIHNRVARQVKTSYKIFAEEWDVQASQVVTPESGELRIAHISSLKERVKVDLDRFSQIAKSLSFAGDYTVADVVSTFEKQQKGVAFLDYMHSAITRLVELRRYRTSETYKATLNSFMRFRGGEDLLLCDISSDMMMDYEAYLKSQGLTNNTISFYMRILRALYNRAVDSELIEQRFPFKRVYTGIDKTIKRALTLKYIRRIKELDLTHHPTLIFARDMFMFSFYTRGMSFVDMAYICKRDLQNGIVSYRRRKSGQQLHIKWERCMQDILDRYPIFNTEYLLPIIRNARKDSRKQYKSMLCLVNVRLKAIGKMVGIVTPLTHYVARHSWASIAKSHNIPISVISEGMGHDSEATTQIYLASLNSSIVDKANSVILKLL